MEAWNQWVFDARNAHSTFAANYVWRSVFVAGQIGSFFITKAIIESGYYNILIQKFKFGKTVETVNCNRMRLLKLCTAIRAVRQSIWCVKYLRYDMPPSMALCWPLVETLLDVIGIALAAQNGEDRLNLVDKIGFIMFICGGIMESGHDFLMNRFKSNPQNKGKIYTKGFANYVIHPNYSGYTLWRSGLALISQNIWFVGCVSTMFCSNFSLISAPELREFCENKYGEKYIEYAKKTYKLIPFIY